MEKSLETDLIATKNQTFTKDVHRRQRLHNTRQGNEIAIQTRNVDGSRAYEILLSG